MVINLLAAAVVELAHGQSRGTLKANFTEIVFCSHGNFDDCEMDLCTICLPTTISGRLPPARVMGGVASSLLVDESWAGHDPCWPRSPLLLHVISSKSALYVSPPAA
jgi:hypothetical protein